MRTYLCDAGYPEVNEVYTDTYLDSVISVPDRSFERSQQKLLQCLTWRRDYNVEGINWHGFTKQLDDASMYWYVFVALPFVFSFPQFLCHYLFKISFSLFDFHFSFLGMDMINLIIPSRG